MQPLVMKYKDISINDVARVGGKNASLGELFNQLADKKVAIPPGFATTAEAFWLFIDGNQIRGKLNELMGFLDKADYSNLAYIGKQARCLIMNASLPEALTKDVMQEYNHLCGGTYFEVAVRSSATAEDLPEASFAGQHESYLNVLGEERLLLVVQKCFASLYTDRAIKYREDNHFSHDKVALSVGIQKMVRSDKACAGVCFTLEPESGFRNVIHIGGVWGLGENIVQGSVTPDEFLVFKPTLQQGKRAIIQKKLGEKSKTMVYSTSEYSNLNTVNIDTPPDKKEQFVLTDEEITRIAKWAQLIEDHYQRPMDIEWAKDGITGELYIVQARPETIHAQKDPALVKEYQLEKKGVLLAEGEAVGSKITTGIARLLRTPADADKLQKDEIVVTEITSPDWDPILKKAAAIITDKGGRTSHASIVARELGVPAVVGTGNATQMINDGEQITVSCCEGKTGFIYKGELKYREITHDFSNMKMPAKTQAMLIVGDPEKAFSLSFYPNNGVGLMRIEFIITHFVQVHPMALVKFNELNDQAAKDAIELLTHHYPDKEQYFVDKLAQGIATIAAAFYPKDVIVRMSDFKTNEYANLIGGAQFEPEEENPMLGFRGASRYYNDRYRQGFRLECEAIKTVRNVMGLTNVIVMIPFCRTVEEGRQVIEVMKANGLNREMDPSLEVYVMAEIPSNVLLAEQFAEIFDGFSIGSNDLTQLTLGIDRDSAIVSSLFSEQNDAAKQMMAMVIKKARAAGKKIGLCGQAPSDFPEFAQFLVQQGIDSISFNADALLKGIENIIKAEVKPMAMVP
ncbi:phosphoenolpyruvate synthase [Niastella yeongjuensis]|uniref:Phosphoenolpyruvate synthase n=1 Tax=Niastella yeongjuensis TaxID=354355 RepID=A0A1V9EUI2_9BACT|nr:phosphoenolpyruvate synthase [Niastella yeongjuensis]OQP49810.1 phosphoenolpyruvate synthase [Niastella yeongjuensis]SEP40070.1 phosphoenolpyruvate synthase [Niastella yeongjuensis]